MYTTLYMLLNFIFVIFFLVLHSVMLFIFTDEYKGLCTQIAVVRERERKFCLFKIYYFIPILPVIIYTNVYMFFRCSIYTIYIYIYILSYIYSLSIKLLSVLVCKRYFLSRYVSFNLYRGFLDLFRQLIFLSRIRFH